MTASYVAARSKMRTVSSNQRISPAPSIDKIDPGLSPLGVKLTEKRPRKDFVRSTEKGRRSFKEFSFYSSLDWIPLCDPATCVSGRSRSKFY